MAWPCITRACCMARFWSQLDKTDIAVPLVFTSYSDAAETQPLHAQVGSVSIETQQPLQSEAERKAAEYTVCASSVMRQDFKPWKVRPEPSCKPKHEYHASETPFNNETQYQKDFKPWPIPRKGDHPWIPKAEGGVEKSQIADRVPEKESAPGDRRKVQAPVKVNVKPGGDAEAEGKSRAADDAHNWQIKEDATAGSSYRNEYKAYSDVKPVKAIRAKSQYFPPDEKTNLETSYSSTYRGEQTHLQPSENRLLERRRIRSLYSEPYMEPSKGEKAIVPRPKAKKTTSSTTHNKPLKKAKEKQATSVRGTKKKATENIPESKPEEGDKEKSKQMNNKLAEAKEEPKQIQASGPSDHPQGAVGGEPEPLVERTEPRRPGVVRFAPDVK